MGDSGRGSPASVSHNTDPLSAYESNVTVRVVTTTSRRDVSKSVPLRDVFCDQRWANAVDDSPLQGHFLSTMTYDEFSHQPKSRVLSYRADKCARFELCDVNDPAHQITWVNETHIPLACLDTPQTKTGWTHLWIDVLHALGDPATTENSYALHNRLCLAVTVLPQSWLTGDPDTCHRAFGRAWVCKEIAFGRVDRDALDLFFETAVVTHAAQTKGLRWDGEPEDLRGPRLLARLIGRRPKAANSEEASDPDVAIAALEWWARVHNANVKSGKAENNRGVARRYTLSPAAARKALETASAARKALETASASSPASDTGKESPYQTAIIQIANDASEEDTDDECSLQLKELIYILQGRQLSDDPAVNAANLEKDPALAWHVICAYVWRPAFPNPYILFDATYGAQLRKYIPTLFTATYASDAFFEATDAYFCSLGVLALACGFDPIGDPLGAWKRKFFRNGKTPPRDRNGKLHFRIEDVDVTVLDNNHAVLRKAWEVLAPRSSWEGIPECLRGVVFVDHARVDWSTRPPGTASLGLGPVPASLMTRGGFAPVGPFFGFDFSKAPNGHRKVGELRGGCGTGRAVTTRGLGDVTGEDGKSFPELTKGVLCPKTYAEEVYEISQTHGGGGRDDVTSVFDSDEDDDDDERGGDGFGSVKNGDGGMTPSLRTSSAPTNGTSPGDSPCPAPATSARRTTSTPYMSLNRISQFAGLAIPGMSSFLSGRSSRAGSLDGGSSISGSEAGGDNENVDGIAGAVGSFYFGYHVLSSWHRNKTHRRRGVPRGRSTSSTQREDDDLEVTLKNIWRAWLSKFDADKDGRISFAELKTFAEKETCLSVDSFMKTFHEWARAALTNGDLETQFAKVDVDGSGELEYPEFRAMLLAGDDELS